MESKKKTRSDSELEKAKGLKFLGINFYSIYTNTKKFFLIVYKKFTVLPKEDVKFYFDLKLGLSEFVPHIPHQNGIDNLLTWILENKNSISNNDNPNKYIIFSQYFIAS